MFPTGASWEKLRTNSPRGSHQEETGNRAKRALDLEDSQNLDASSSSSAVKGHLSEPPDALLLYWSLVADQAVPPGYERNFLELERAMNRTSDASVRKAAKVDSVTAAVWLHARTEAETKLEKREKRVEDQFFLAAQERPTRFKCRWQQQYFEGASARRVAEEHLRRKGIENLFRAAKTPMGELISSGLPGAQPLGAGRWASTLRSRVRAARRFLAWLALAHAISFPTEVSHFTEYVQTRHAEPSNRGSLKVAHNSFVFLVETAAVELKLTQQSLYGAVYKELLAPRLPVALVEALERNVLREDALFYHRVYSWWILLQCWGTLRFSDHRGLSPDEHFAVEGNALTATLTRSKTIGTGK